MNYDHLIPLRWVGNNTKWHHLWSQTLAWKIPLSCWIQRWPLVSLRPDLKKVKWRNPEEGEGEQINCLKDYLPSPLESQVQLRYLTLQIVLEEMLICMEFYLAIDRRRYSTGNMDENDCSTPWERYCLKWLIASYLADFVVKLHRLLHSIDRSQRPEVRSEDDMKELPKIFTLLYQNEVYWNLRSWIDDIRNFGKSPPRENVFVVFLLVQLVKSVEKWMKPRVVRVVYV